MLGIKARLCPPGLGSLQGLQEAALLPLIIVLPPPRSCRSVLT